MRRAVLGPDRTIQRALRQTDWPVAVRDCGWLTRSRRCMSSLKRKRDAWRDRCPASVTFHALTIVIVLAVCAFAASAARSRSPHSGLICHRVAPPRHNTQRLKLHEQRSTRRVAPSTEVSVSLPYRESSVRVLHPKSASVRVVQIAVRACSPRIRIQDTTSLSLVFTVHTARVSQCRCRRSGSSYLKKITYGYAHTHPHLPRPTTPHCRPPAGLTLAAPRRRRGRAYQAIARPSRPYVAKLHNSPSAPPNCTTRAAQEAHPIHRWQMRCLKGLGGYETPRPCWDREIIDCD